MRISLSFSRRSFESLSQNPAPQAEPALHVSSDSPATSESGGSLRVLEQGGFAAKLRNCLSRRSRGTSADFSAISVSSNSVVEAAPPASTLNTKTGRISRALNRIKTRFSKKERAPLLNPGLDPIDWAQPAPLVLPGKPETKASAPTENAPLL